VSRSANELLAKNHIGEGRAPVVSDFWSFTFWEYYPVNFKKRQKTINHNSKCAHDVDIVDDRFHHFCQLYALYNIDIVEIWNVDETSFMIGMRKYQ
jgi:hypothetical protein